MPAFNSSASRSKEPMNDFSSLENYEMLKKFIQKCSGLIDAIHIEDIAKYPTVSVKITPETKLMKDCAELDIHKVTLEDSEQLILNLESHIDQLGYLLRDVKLKSLSTLLPIDTTKDVIKELAQNKKWFSEIKEKTFNITGLNDCVYWRQLRVDRVYRSINGFLKTTRKISEINIDANVIKIATGTMDSMKSTTFCFDVQETISEARLDAILALSLCVSGVRVSLCIALSYLNFNVGSQCLDSLGVKYRINTAYSPPRYACFSYQSLGPIAIALEQ